MGTNRFLCFEALCQDDVVETLNTNPHAKHDQFEDAVHTDIRFSTVSRDIIILGQGIYSDDVEATSSTFAPAVLPLCRSSNFVVNSSKAR